MVKKKTDTDYKKEIFNSVYHKTIKEVIKKHEARIEDLEKALAIHLQKHEKAMIYNVANDPNIV